MMDCQGSCLQGASERKRTIIMTEVLFPTTGAFALAILFSLAYVLLYGEGLLLAVFMTLCLRVLKSELRYGVASARRTMTLNEDRSSKNADNKDYSETPPEVVTKADPTFAANDTLL